MQRPDEKLCLQWNDFRDNIGSAFRELRGDKDFTDVTLVCEDGEQVEAHKLVLVSSSPFFRNLLARVKHAHPLVFMRGAKSEDFVAILDFLYYGEANVCQKNLDAFLTLAGELQLNGLQENGAGDEFDEAMIEATNRKPKEKPKPKPAMTQNAESLQTVGRNEIDQVYKTETAIWLDDHPGTTDLTDLEQKVKSMMEMSENPAPGKTTGKGRKCKVCGKEGSMQTINVHIETNHIPGLALSCELCGKVLKSRNMLRYHKLTSHK